MMESQNDNAKITPSPLMEDVSLENDENNVVEKNALNQQNIIPSTKSNELIANIEKSVIQSDDSQKVSMQLTLDDPVINTIERACFGNNQIPHIKIRIVEPQKVGEGISAYVVYKLITKVFNVTGIQQTPGEEWHVIRRYSDFLGLHEKLTAKYAHLGYVIPVPPSKSLLGYVIPVPPSKSLLGMTKLKISSKDDTFSADFAERRRAALERYINRTANHATLMIDPSLHEFLSVEGELPRSTNTSTLSSNNMLRIIGRLADNISSKLSMIPPGTTNASFNNTSGSGAAISFIGSAGNDSGNFGSNLDNTNTTNNTIIQDDINEHWFEEMQNQIENLDSQMRKLHASVEALVHHRKELSNSTAAFSKALALLANAEESHGLSRALSQLSQVEERIEQISGSDILNLNPSVHADQFGNDTTNLMVGLAHNDFFVLCETLKDYVSLIGAVKQAFTYRQKAWNNLMSAQNNLLKKRKELSTNLNLLYPHNAGNNSNSSLTNVNVPPSNSSVESNVVPAKIAELRNEIKDWEERTAIAHKEYELISANIRREVTRFERERIKEFKDTFVLYLQNLLKAQNQIVKCWEAFLPEAHAIA